MPIPRSMTSRLAPWTVPSFLAIFVGYIVTSTLLQYFFYYRRRRDAPRWKTQATQQGGLGDHHWWLPALHSHAVAKERHRLHGCFATVNLVIASAFAGMTAELTSRGLTRLHSQEGPPVDSRDGAMLGQGWALEALWLLLALTWQSVLEYVWHLAMHSRWCYARLHKYHHHYKSPEPFDDMFIHPVEAFGYYCILYSPAYVLPLHVYTFLVYMSLLGTFGVLDHSGIRLSIPGLYATEDHDRHHSHFEVNYCFPFPYLDILCGTYMGTFLGRTYNPRSKRRGSLVGQNRAGGEPGERSDEALIKQQ